MNVDFAVALRRAIAVSCACTLLAISMGVRSARAEATNQKELVAVLDMQAVGATAAQASALTDRFREALFNSGRYVLVDRSQMKAILSEQAFQQTGCTSKECAVKVGRILGVRKIVTSKISRPEAGLWLLSAQMTDVETAATLAEVSVLFRGDYVGVLSEAVAKLAAKLPGNTVTTLGSRLGKAQQAGFSTPPKFKTWREAITGMKFVLVPGGTYIQGCGAWDKDCDSDEKPTRKVTISPFWLGITEVTQGQWKKVMGYDPSTYKKGLHYPVEEVSWHDSQRFIRRLNARDPRAHLRLPTEAEWEYACRSGGKPIEYAWGNGRPDVDGHKAANVADETLQLQLSLAKIWNGYDDGYVYTAPVGTFSPNALGLFDMTGNVWEWVEDAYDGDAYSSGSVTNPVDSPTDTGLTTSYAGSMRVLRGGGWNNGAHRLRCTFRRGYTQDTRAPDLGFRAARSQ